MIKSNGGATATFSASKGLSAGTTEIVLERDTISPNSSPGRNQNEIAIKSLTIQTEGVRLAGG